MTTLLRFPSVCKRVGLARTTIYDCIKKGLFPALIKFRPRASAWPEFEVDAVLDAFIKGKSPDEIKELVSQLQAKRRE
jgi:prophage regulatory protein